jgi:hypothetical protein
MTTGWAVLFLFPVGAAFYLRQFEQAVHLSQFLIQWELFFSPGVKAVEPGTRRQHRN